MFPHSLAYPAASHGECARYRIQRRAGVMEGSDVSRLRISVGRLNFGLQAGVFTRDMHEINHAFSNLEVDGGIKDSGLGREGLRYAILDMMEPKILVTDTHS